MKDMLFSIPELYEKRKYYILTIYFYDKKKILLKEFLRIKKALYFLKKFWNINFAIRL